MKINLSEKCFFSEGLLDTWLVKFVRFLLSQSEEIQINPSFYILIFIRSV